MAHPNFNVDELEYDFAILKVQDYRSIPNLLTTVGVACLPIGFNFTNHLAQSAKGYGAWCNPAAFEQNFTASFKFAIHMFKGPFE